ncbi:hypothetical protein [Flavobacterium sp. 3HN19-14]|uniref:hypothetical protein n=1 Tax=Flavobacterium sp. 3HN19-14 TaxID=3448133 RepID=UPI003EE32087
MKLATEITPGMQFKKSGQLEWREAKEIVDCDKVPNAPAHNKGKLMFLLISGRQIFVGKDEWLVTNENQVSNNTEEIQEVLVNVTYLATVHNLKELGTVIPQVIHRGKVIWIDKNQSAISPDELYKSKIDLYPVTVFRLVPSSELIVLHVSPSNN